MLHLGTSCQYYLYNDNTDMRKGFDSLCGIISSQMQLEIMGGAIFIFFNKKRNQVKLLLWEGDGLSIYYKRLEKGTYERPNMEEGKSSCMIAFTIAVYFTGCGTSKNSVSQAISENRLSYPPPAKNSG